MSEADKIKMDKIKYPIAHKLGIAVGSVIVLLFIIMIIIGIIVIHGFVIKMMWGWFLTPLGLPALSIVHAVGLGLLFKYLTWQHSKNDKEEDASISLKLITAIIYPFLILGLGYITYLFM